MFVPTTTPPPAGRGLQNIALAVDDSHVLGTGPTVELNRLSLSRHWLASLKNDAPCLSSVSSILWSPNCTWCRSPAAKSSTRLMRFIISSWYVLKFNRNSVSRSSSIGSFLCGRIASRAATEVSPEEPVSLSSIPVPTGLSSNATRSGCFQKGVVRRRLTVQ